MTAPLFDVESAVVEVNECRVFGTVAGAAWWALYRHVHDARITTITATLGGAVVHVACASRADAQWLAAHMVAVGLPKAAVRIPKTSKQDAPTLDLEAS